MENSPIPDTENSLFSKLFSPKAEPKKIIIKKPVKKSVGTAPAVHSQIIDFSTIESKKRILLKKLDEAQKSYKENFEKIKSEYENSVNLLEAGKEPENREIETKVEVKFKIKVTKEQLPVILERNESENFDFKPTAHSGVSEHVKAHEAEDNGFKPRPLGTKPFELSGLEQKMNLLEVKNEGAVQNKEINIPIYKTRPYTTQKPVLNEPNYSFNPIAHGSHNEVNRIAPSMDNQIIKESKNLDAFKTSSDNRLINRKPQNSQDIPNSISKSSSNNFFVRKEELPAEGVSIFPKKEPNSESSFFVNKNNLPNISSHPPNQITVQNIIQNGNSIANSLNPFNPNHSNPMSSLSQVPPHNNLQNYPASLSQSNPFNTPTALPIKTASSNSGNFFANPSASSTSFFANPPASNTSNQLKPSNTINPFVTGSSLGMMSNPQSSNQYSFFQSNDTKINLSNPQSFTTGFSYTKPQRDNPINNFSNQSSGFTNNFSSLTNETSNFFPHSSNNSHLIQSGVSPFGQNAVNSLSQFNTAAPNRSSAFNQGLSNTSASYTQGLTNTVSTYSQPIPNNSFNSIPSGLRQNSITTIEEYTKFKSEILSNDFSLKPLLENTKYLANSVISNLAVCEMQNIVNKFKSSFNGASAKYVMSMKIKFASEMVDIFVHLDNDLECLESFSRHITAIVKTSEDLSTFFLFEIQSQYDILSSRHFSIEQGISELRLEDLQRYYKGGILQEKVLEEQQKVKNAAYLLAYIHIENSQYHLVKDLLGRIVYNTEINRKWFAAISGLLQCCKRRSQFVNSNELYDLFPPIRDKFLRIKDQFNFLPFYPFFTQIIKMIGS